MSENALRARIDRIISEVSGGQSSHQEHAQAIIDEFGLEVETRKLGGMRKDGAPFARTRVIGKWEQTPDHTTRTHNTY